MNPIIVLALGSSGVLGGAETYAVRIASRFIADGYTVLLMQQENACNVPYLENAIKELGMERIKLPCLKSNPNVIDWTKANVDFPEGSHVRILCLQTPVNFFAAQMIAYRAKSCHVQIFHYIIHEDDYCRNKTQKTNSVVLQGVLRGVYRRILQRMEKKHAIVYMTEEYLKNIHANFDLPYDANLPIIRLGMEVKPYDEVRVARRAALQPFTAITMTRFDFPAKGYVLGLVDEFAQILKLEPSARLVIIGTGPDEKKILDKIRFNGMEQAVQMVGQVDYNALPAFFDKAHVFIGITTGVLDASNEGLPSIVATINMEECLCSGFLYEHPTNLGYDGNKPVYTLLEQVLRMDTIRYEEAAQKNYRAFCDTYDIKQSARQLISLENDGAILGRTALYILKLGRICIDAALCIRQKISRQLT